MLQHSVLKIERNENVLCMSFLSFCDMPIPTIMLPCRMSLPMKLFYIFSYHVHVPLIMLLHEYANNHVVACCGPRQHICCPQRHIHGQHEVLARYVSHKCITYLVITCVSHLSYYHMNVLGLYILCFFWSKCFSVLCQKNNGTRYH